MPRIGVGAPAIVIVGSGVGGPVAGTDEKLKLLEPSVEALTVCPDVGTSDTSMYGVDTPVCVNVKLCVRSGNASLLAIAVPFESANDQPFASAVSVIALLDVTPFPITQ